MKKESPLWSSISLLIGIVIAILALIRGRMLLPLLLAVFALWLLWWLLTQALPLWRNNRAYYKRPCIDSQSIGGGYRRLHRRLRVSPEWCTGYGCLRLNGKRRDPTL